MATVPSCNAFIKTPNMSYARGFTLIELVLLIVLLGILSVFVLPKFASRSSFSEYTARDQLISAYRFAQQRAMYDHSGNCYRLLIDASGFGPQVDNGSGFAELQNFERISLTTGDYVGLTITSATLFFDGLGNVLDSCGGTQLGSDTTLTISGSDSLNICINPIGYARAC